MKPAISHRKRLARTALITYAVLMFVAVILLALPHSSKKSTISGDLTKSSKLTDVSADDNNAYQVVLLSNLQPSDGGIDSNDVAEIESQLYQRVQDVNDLIETSYQGAVRQGTLTTSYTSYQNDGRTIQLPTYHFLVDVPSVQQTWQVSLTGGTNYPQDDVSVSCPASNQLIYPAFACEDPR